jgi:membrane-associated phospholipid phosphatase
MTKEQYEKWTKNLREDDNARESLIKLNTTLTYLCYFLYPLLLVLAYFADKSEFLRILFTAGIPFVVFSLVRRFLNFKRPYEELDIDPIIKKKTKGKSFPSRHIFSCFLIAMCWMKYSHVLGIFLIFAGLFLAVARVLGGVHYPRDVIVGGITGIVCGVIGMFVI